MTEHSRLFLIDLAVCILLMSLVLGGTYLYGNASYSAVDFLDGMGDFLTGPIYPGIYLIYPPLGVAILVACLAACYKMKSRFKRFPIILGIVFTWMWLGLLTSVQYYGYTLVVV